MTLIYLPHDTTKGKDPFEATGYNLSDQDQVNILGCKLEVEFLDYLSNLKPDKITSNASIITDNWESCLEKLKAYA